MNVKIKMSRAENVAMYGAEPVTLDIEEYLLGVVPAEIYESAAMDALKAQAVAARTYVLKRALEGTVITDTSNHQAYKFSLSQSCPRSRQAVTETKGEVLFHDGKLINCFYSASNGGITKRSGDVWSQHYPYYVSKIDEWDAEANREKPTKASHGIGMSQIGAMWAAKNGVPYKQILSFYYEGTALASNYGQGGFSLPHDAEEEYEGTVIAPDCGQSGFPLPTDTVEEKVVAPLVIHERIMTKNDSYAYGRKIVPKGIMVHSTAAPGVMAAQWFDRWNKSYKAGETTRQVSVHAFVDDKEVWQYLPWDQRAWHAAGKANDTHIAFELCEPGGFKYAGGANMVGYDTARHEPYFRAAWRNSVRLCVILCRQYGIPVANIIGHFEGRKMGIAGNHADPGHWFKKHNESMDTFRAAVRSALEGDADYYVDYGSSPPSPPVAEYTHYTVQPGDTLWAIARDRLGTGSRYTDIMALNNMGSSSIRIGQVLLLPELPQLFSE